MSADLLHDWSRLTVLGEGKHRIVYAHPKRPNRVLKVDKTGVGRNLDEYRNSALLREAGFGKWIARAYQITPDGSVLMAARAEPIDEPPPVIPAFFRDRRTSNWGRIDGRPVCLDYTDLAELTRRHREPRWKP